MAKKSCQQHTSSNRQAGPPSAGEKRAAPDATSRWPVTNQGGQPTNGQAGYLSIVLGKI
jgi:hypothetical protein